MGYSSFSISGGRLYTMGSVKSAEKLHAFDLASGKPAWSVKVGDKFQNNRGSGPRGTPTISGDLVYALGTSGWLGCYKTSDGTEVWKLNVFERFGSKNINWGLSESVLIEGDLLICGPGGMDSAVVALDRKTGKTIWTSKGLNDKAGYASAIAATIAGKRQVIHFNHSSAVGVSLSDGSTLWRYTKASNGIANCATPVVVGNNVFLTSDYGQGCAMLELSASGAREIYFNKDLQNHHGGVVYLDGKIYGHSGGNSSRTHNFVCMDFKTGKVVWKEKGIGKCSIVWADGLLYCLTEDGKMGIAKVSPGGYELVSSFVFKKYKRFKTGGIRDEDDKPCWAHPVVAGGKLFLRDQDNIFCYDISSK